MTPTLSHESILKASLSELQSTLRILRQIRSAQKRAGKRWLESVLGKKESIRVELPVWSTPEMANHLLKKLGVSPDSCEYKENAKLIGGIRVFIGDTLYDGSLTTLTQKI